MSTLEALRPVRWSLSGASVWLRAWFRTDLLSEQSRQDSLMPYWDLGIDSFLSSLSGLYRPCQSVNFGRSTMKTLVHFDHLSTIKLLECSSDGNPRALSFSEYSL
ncbi:hypothetical protein ElyMa_000485400 [Elysia marginata]|uniref:Uncharacterized protein n=1 Tax=Elysia marginata TaxID=1093978 RepID=A0AAV4FTY9_9GAST|nr:hypothetical protein ElyMa_000485400 [Elysia marginata]